MGSRRRRHKEEKGSEGKRGTDELSAGLLPKFCPSRADKAVETRYGPRENRRGPLAESLAGVLCGCAVAKSPTGSLRGLPPTGAFPFV